MMKFPIKVSLSLAAHKISLILQAILGGIDVLKDKRFEKQHNSFSIDVGVAFQHAHRLTRCIVECAVIRSDSVTARNALELARSLSAKAWDDSPLQLTQIEKIGVVSARKLASAGIRSIEDFENTDAQKLDMVLSKNPPFSTTLLQRVQTFPKLFVYLRKVDPPVSCCMALPIEVNTNEAVNFQACHPQHRSFEDQRRAGISQPEAAQPLLRQSSLRLHAGRDI